MWSLYPPGVLLAQVGAAVDTRGRGRHPQGDTASRRARSPATHADDVLDADAARIIVDLSGVTLLATAALTVLHRLRRSHRRPPGR